jgi:hypothetical protein
MFHMVVVLGFRDSVAFEDHILFWFLGQSQMDDLVCSCRYKLGCQ